MNHYDNLNTAPKVATLESDDAATRRLLIRAGLLAGGAILGTSLLRSAHAQDAKPEDAGANPPLAPGDLTTGQSPATMSPQPDLALDPEKIPKTAIIKTVARPGKSERNDVDILNYALLLEFLEADFYTRVVQADDARAFLTGRPKTLARVLARDENTHVQVVSDAIRSLGGTPRDKPEFQFPTNAFISQIGFLTTSASLEETGVSAYLGQGANVKRKDVLNFAATIYGNEARHTGLIRFFLGDTLAARDSELPLSRTQVFERVRPFLVNPDAALAPVSSEVMAPTADATMNNGTMNNGTTPPDAATPGTTTPAPTP